MTSDNLYTLVDLDGNLVLNSHMNPIVTTSRDKARERKKKLRKEARILRYSPVNFVR